MDMGDGAAFVYRDNKKEIMIPMPIFGHWMKQPRVNMQNQVRGKISHLPECNLQSKKNKPE